MITLRRAEERRHLRRHAQELWLSFYSQGEADPLAEGFSALETLNEDRLPPGAGFTLRPRHASEIITYVREGALAYEDSKGRSGVVRAGEFQRVSGGHGVRHSETNASATDWAHAFQLWLYPSEGGPEPDQELKRFGPGERQGVLCLVASPDGRDGSLHVRQDALLYSAVLDAGQHLAHALPPSRSAWLHVVSGEVALGDLVLVTGDGAGVSADHVVALQARRETEILLVDLPALPIVSRHDFSPGRGTALTNHDSWLPQLGSLLPHGDRNH